MSSSGLSAVLNVNKWVNGIPLVDPSNPIRWGRLAAALGLGTATSIVLGIQQVIASWFASIVDVWTGVTEFVVGTEGVAAVGTDLIAGVGSPQFGSRGLLDVLFGPITAALVGVWSFNVEQFGALALPVSIIIALLVIYVFTQFVLRAYRVLLGGEAI